MPSPDNPYLRHGDSNLLYGPAGGPGRPSADASYKDRTEALEAEIEALTARMAALTRVTGDQIAGWRSACVDNDISPDAGSLRMALARRRVRVTPYTFGKILTMAMEHALREDSEDIDSLVFSVSANWKVLTDETRESIVAFVRASIAANRKAKDSLDVLADIVGVK